MEATSATTVGAQGNGSSLEREQIEVTNPATGAVSGSVPRATEADVRDTVARVRRNQPAWEELGFEGRAKWLDKLRDWLVDNHETLADTLQSESGKTRIEASLEGSYCAHSIKYYTKNAEKFLSEETPRGRHPLIIPKQLKIIHRPHEVVGIIGPWNYPLILTLGDAIPALAAGASVVIKPASLTPLALREIIRAWKHEIGGPDVLDIVCGGSDVGRPLINEVDFIGFTGSEETGKSVMRDAAENLIGVSLELGGKDPMVVLADADMERAVNGAAFGGLINCGQTCISVERVYVEEPIYDEFVDRLAEKVRGLKQGADDRSYKVDLGAMVDPSQIDIVERHVEDARERGARILTGGKRREGQGQFYEPTVIADVDHSMQCMVEETFGPTIPVMKVRDAEEAIRLANDSKYGLSSSVWSGSRARGEAVARRIQAGSCNVNDVIVNYFATEVPFGGWKASGISSRHGEHGIRKFTKTESLVITRVATKSELSWYPHTKPKGRLIRTVMQFSNGRGIRQRLGL
ncbi:MAG: aldehyde dehydrogenase family protein [Solirubrobacterales bacterium]